ncbi:MULTISPECIES: helix-turn-helix domain-containing protein [unclassified Bradyrhizobium]|uniref:AraC family transcriptional regulator n=1 Tax=unclassified Bradyrhizobium TaxID=2631580 RepID=UPI001BADE85A|nr:MULTISPECIES: helix-turn-helix domain-containing protein [unclassified Bradyrhizobium]MBR1226908.1 helix-turn-helix transcriptional regulator [Bradyrhizobium sp. AUGA SZCCT0176]MBR1296747.1 helix-turn-helix transcriptional regulator [Bradyrhizobium sp. AUGA SZCCT0042]
MGSSGLLSIDLGLRGAAAGLALLIAAVGLRDLRDSTVARLGAAVAISAAASAICSAPNFPRPWQWWSLFLLALTAGSSVLFWLWARAAFDDDFVLRRWHGALWVAMAGTEVLVAGGAIEWPMPGQALDRAVQVASLGLALLAVAQTLATWPADMVEGRRRQRLVVLIGASVYIAIVTLLNIFPSPLASGASIASVGKAFGLCVLMGLYGWFLLRAVGMPEGPRPLPATDILGDINAVASDAEDKPPVVEPALLRRLQQLMLVDRAYRREGLTIGVLSAELAVPEYRLRQLINEGMGHRNFNAFLNRYRIEEAKAALADPGQKEVPVLTIAMDTGFQSIGPFNRAFKAATDLTPTEFRHLAMARNALIPLNAGASSAIGKPD